ncbi:unnamed protein product [Owenia fusiformis]|uniref:Proton-coupled zinc antiporter SLC30A5 n=1 Tax=Owenia fusiformis TaxID=6347 RepID=A0A8J1XSC4_OWEFU|nr:unnamed protein product [Owenia fusiformis]
MRSTGAIYPRAGLTPYILLLLGSKALRAFGLYLSYDLLKLIHVVQFLFIAKLGSSVVLIFLQKPFSGGKRLSKNQWFRICRHALIGSLLNLLWLYGLTLCGPLRAILIFEHSDLVVIAALSALFTHNGGGPAKLRGAMFLLLAVTGILLFDHDDYRADAAEHTENHHKSIITHLFNHFTNWSGLSDHKGGVMLLFFTLCMWTGYSSASKKLSLDVGGAKRLHALSTLISAILLSPWAGFIYVTRESEDISLWSVVIPLTIVILIVFLADYYIDAISIQRLDAPTAAKFGSMAVFTGALVISFFWNHPYASKITSMHHIVEVVQEDHVLSGGVIFSYVLIMFATHILTNPSKMSKGSFIGYSAAGLPLYTVAGEALHRTSQSVLTVAKNGLQQILSESDSRKIFYFLCINLAFTFVELIYGVWTNSLGLISDGFHMLFDCSALVMGLYAAVMSKWKATRIYSYGYDRIEVLSGFINGVFLVVISFFVFTEALERLFDPPEVSTERLLAVSVAGLIVNLVGITAFRHAHSHGGGGGHGHSHGGGHGHAHGGQGHGHSNSNHSHSNGNHGHSHAASEPCASSSTHHNTNMEGVFLHVLADTLGSVGVIISSILIENFGWNIADPICSIFIGTLIFLSVIPLLKETTLILALRTPAELEGPLNVSLQKVLDLEGVLSYREQHFWQHSSNVTCGTLHVQVTKGISEQKIISQITAIFKDIGINNMTVQVETEAYFQHMTGLGSQLGQVEEITQNLRTLNYQQTVSMIKAI